MACPCLSKFRITVCPLPRRASSVSKENSFFLLAQASLCSNTDLSPSSHRLLCCFFSSLFLVCFRSFKRVKSGLRRVEPKANGASRAVPMLGDDQVGGPGCLALRVVEVIAVDEEHHV